MHHIEFREYTWGSNEYGQALILRNRLLRRPLGLCLYDEDLSVEKAYRHMGAFLDGQLIATLLFTPGENGLLHMKQVAVTPAMQGKGIGLGLVQFSEGLLQKEGVPGIFLHARETAVGFYRKAGYTVVGDTFYEVGIPHRHMEKRWA